MTRQYWIVKQEPSAYAWSDLEREGRTVWTGVRNFQARNHLRSMRRGDWVGFYHSGEAKALVGLARVEREAYPDPTAEEGDWSCVVLGAVRSLCRPVPLAVIKRDPALAELALVRNSRLSVMPASAAEFARLLVLAETPAPR